MRWATAVATPTHLGDAMSEAAEMVLGELQGAAPDLVLAFVSSHHSQHVQQFPDYAQALFPGAAVTGCSAAGVIAAGRELEDEAAVAVMAAVLPDVDVSSFHLGPDPDTWSLDPAGSPEVVVFADPYSCDAQALVAWLDRELPESTKIGGLASGGSGAGTHALFAGDQVHRTGAVGVTLRGNLEVDTIVAQGCRPIGQPMFVTRTAPSAIVELDGQPALAALELLFEELPPDDQRLVSTGLHFGVGMRDASEVYEHGDFLIRTVYGGDPEGQAIAVDHVPATGQVVQFHLRDATTSAEELSELLSRHHYADPAGALLFSYVGRGKNLYGEADHDSRTFAEHFGPVPLAGFFGNGEIGPVHGTTFVHRLTSSFGLFRPKRR